MSAPRTTRRLLLPLALALTAVLGIGATSASAAINRGVTQTVAGTNCVVTVGGWPNTSRHPGVASRVSCSSRHTIQVRNQIWYAGTNNVPVLFAQSGWYTYPNTYGTPEIDNYRAWCAGHLDWLSGAQVYVDGVYRGTYYNAWGWWTACT